MPMLEFTKKDKKNNIVKVGSMEVKNQTDESADIYFFGDICSESWQSDWYEEDTCPKDVEDMLKTIESDKALNIHINSGGGSVCGGVAIYNLLKRHKGFKTVYVEGLAASIASVIAMAGDKIIIPSNAILMVHKPWAYCVGNANDLRKEADILDVHQKTILNTYMQRTKEGIEEDTVNELMENETWMSGEEAERYFDMEVAEASDTAASSSSFFERYSKVPDKLKKHDETSNISVEAIADAVIKKLEEKEHTDSEDKKNELEKRKQAILSELDLI